MTEKWKDVSQQECIDWLRKEIEDADTPLRKAVDTNDELRAQDIRKALLNFFISNI